MVRITKIKILNLAKGRLKMNTIKTEEAPVYNIPTNEDDIITQAIKICESRLKVFGQYFNDVSTTKKYCILKMSNLDIEYFDVIFLNTQHQLIECVTMFTGTIDGASVYPREVVKKALELNAAAVIFAHNHPSGITEPSTADRTITNKLKSSLDLFDIRVLDHIIVAGINTYSFAEHGVI